MKRLIAILALCSCCLSASASDFDHVVVYMRTDISLAKQKALKQGLLAYGLRAVSKDVMHIPSGTPAKICAFQKQQFKDAVAGKLQAIRDLVGEADPDKFEIVLISKSTFWNWFSLKSLG